MANSGGGFGLIHFGNIDGIVGNDDMFRKPQAFLEFSEILVAGVIGVDLQAYSNEDAYRMSR
ncbi:MAG TPA: hypothetical protein DIC58_00265, partial [Gammaproteobacteria bacterium]|nr:hypothetical protein [Gammaproteobacteria bacterium]